MTLKAVVPDVAVTPLGTHAGGWRRHGVIGEFIDPAVGASRLDSLLSLAPGSLGAGHTRGSDAGA